MKPLKSSPGFMLGNTFLGLLLVSALSENEVGGLTSALIHWTSTEYTIHSSSIVSQKVISIKGETFVSPYPLPVMEPVREWIEQETPASIIKCANGLTFCVVYVWLHGILTLIEVFLAPPIYSSIF